MAAPGPAPSPPPNAGVTPRAGAKASAVASIWNLPVLTLSSLLLLSVLHTVDSKGPKQAHPECHLIDAGGCRGPGWDSGDWPVAADLEGQASAETCCRACFETKGCTSFHFTPPKAKSKPKGSCFLFGHEDISVAAALGGECHRIVRGGSPANQGNDEAPETCKKFIEKACGNTKPEPKDAGNAKVKGSQSKVPDVEKEPSPKPAPPAKKDKVEDKAEVKVKQDDKLEKPKASKEPKAAHVEDEDTKAKADGEPKDKPVTPKDKEVKKVTEKPPPSQPQKAEKAKEAPKAAVEDEPKKDKVKPDMEEKGKASKKAQEAPAKVKVEEAKAVKKGGDEDDADKKVKKSVKVEEPPKPKKDAASPKKAAKKVDTGPREYDGQFLEKVGSGGCRGRNWDKNSCPKFVGRRTLDQCAKECRKADFCTAFHILKPNKDQTFDCLLFSHKNVIAVPALGGLCYRFSDTPPGAPKVDDEAGLDDEDDDDWEVEPDLGDDDGSAKAIELGQGLCRGPKWTFGQWPVASGRRNLEGCASQCARKKGCTAFDVSHENKGKFDCWLYGHKAVQPASGVSGRCYILPSSPLAKLVDRPLADLDGDDDDDDDDDDEKDDGDDDDDDDDDAVGYIKLGSGRCRGNRWTTRRWPKDKGFKTLGKCASACSKKLGCTGFDLSPKDSGSTGTPGPGEKRCHLYGHRDLHPATGVPGECYRVPKDPSEAPGEDEDDAANNVGHEASKIHLSVADVDESQLSSIPNQGEDFVNLGKGLCRGPNWQRGEVWPKDEGKESFIECLTECRKNPGCTAFDLAPVHNSVKFQCILHGHENVIPATALKGRCIRMQGRHQMPLSSATSSRTGSKAASTAGDPSPAGDDYQVLGQGLCRGSGWTSKRWPKDAGMKTLKDCFGACSKTGGCTAFDTRDPEGKKFHCFLFGHKDVAPASGLKGMCYKMPAGMVLPPDDQSSDDTGAYEAQEAAEAPEGLNVIGTGACRGPGWQTLNGVWPQVRGLQTHLGCVEECASLPGCTAFDLRPPDDQSSTKSTDMLECTLYGHQPVVPASAIKATCYRAGLSASVGVAAGQRRKAQTPPKASGKGAKKVPEFAEPEVLEDDVQGSDDDDQWLFEPPPPQVRSRTHIAEILHLAEIPDPTVGKAVTDDLKELKKIYENSIKPLETVYKYKEFSNRHFGDPEIFNKPLIVLMGPWSGGKSTMINYLLGTEFTKNSFRAAAEPSPGFNFNIAMHGDREEDLEGMELTAEWSFSSMQKFGQEFLKKIKVKKFPNQLLERATFAEIPGVLETGTKRKVDRMYPFNDACQWFIDHADLILLMYDYTKLDIGPETEALLDQLKGRESQVRIILNKADEITAEELLKIQGNLVWNVSPLMSSLEPPQMYAGSFWSRPYKEIAPKKLLRSQEVSLLKDIQTAIEKRVENRIATARRFAVRVRNHAKMIDVYLTTLNNKKGVFGSRKKVAEDIVQNPDKYHIYDGISSMTNISRYDLPDPKTYETFFALHPLQDFPTLQSTCTFFKGCPINKLDLAIAYELPDLLTKHKRKVIDAKSQNSGPDHRR